MQNARAFLLPKFWHMLTMLLVLAMVCVQQARGEDNSAAVLERHVKAAYLYKFASYVTWPENVFSSATAPVTIAVIGDDDLAQDLGQTINGRSVEGRPLQLQRVQPNDPLPEAQIFYIGRSENHRIGELVVKICALKPALIVTEEPSALGQGAMLNFIKSADRVRFEVSLDAVEKRGLSLSSRLLTVAQNVFPQTAKAP